MASKIKERQLQTKLKEVIGIQKELEAMPNVYDVSNFDVKREREKLENMLDDHLIVSSYIFKLKSRLNMLVPINKLPVKLFIRVIRLTSKETRKKCPSYVPCTWVCHHWRSVLIQTPNLWTTLQLGKAGCAGSLPITPFDREFLKRSKSAGLDIDLWSDFDGYLPMLEEFFTKESNRIHKLNFHGNSIGSIPPAWLAKIRFPSLREFVDHSSPLTNDLYFFLPCTIASDHLETLGLEFRKHFPINMLDQLTPKFRRLRRLSLIISKGGVIQFVLDALQNNSKLRSLKLITPDTPVFNEIILPELEFLSTNDETLLQNVQAPKLSTLHLCSNHLPNTFNNNSILEKFDYSSIKHLHILSSWSPNAHFIMGSNETVHSKSVLSVTSEDFPDQVDLINGCRSVAGNILSDTWKHGCFRLEFTTKEALVQTLEGAFSTIFPRLTGLSEICLMSNALFEVIHFDKILIQLPSLEKLIVSGSVLVECIRRLCNTPLLCPRLKYLSYKIVYWDDIVLEEDENENFAEDLGKLLVECLQSRYKSYRNMLEYIVFGNCPPLPDYWLDECKRLGTTVITERGLEGIESTKRDDSDSETFERYSQASDESEPGSEDYEEEW